MLPIMLKVLCLSFAEVVPITTRPYLSSLFDAPPANTSPYVHNSITPIIHQKLPEYCGAELIFFSVSFFNISVQNRKLTSFFCHTSVVNKSRRTYGKASIYWDLSRHRWLRNLRFLAVRADENCSAALFNQINGSRHEQQLIRFCLLH